MSTLYLYWAAPCGQADIPMGEWPLGTAMDHDFEEMRARTTLKQCGDEDGRREIDDGRFYWKVRL